MPFTGSAASCVPTARGTSSLPASPQQDPEIAVVPSPRPLSPALQAEGIHRSCSTSHCPPASQEPPKNIPEIPGETGERSGEPLGLTRQAEHPNLLSSYSLLPQTSHQELLEQPPPQSRGHSRAFPPAGRAGGRIGMKNPMRAAGWGTGCCPGWGCPLSPFPTAGPGATPGGQRPPLCALGSSPIPDLL